MSTSAVVCVALASIRSAARARICWVDWVEGHVDVGAAVERGGGLGCTGWVVEVARGRVAVAVVPRHPQFADLARQPEQLEEAADVVPG